ncbi:MAG TPA: hypothetical protein VFQ88_13280 [Nevskiaceae bacterium]|nr:hypothetical protein [Nevskiaceae bacterium]
MLFVVALTLLAPVAHAASVSGNGGIPPDGSAPETMPAVAMPSNAGVEGSASMQATGSVADESWQGYFKKLQDYTQSRATGKAATALTQAANADIRSQRGNVGLNLTGGFTDYPNGGGTGNGGSGGSAAGATNNTFTDLRQYAEARVNWKILGFFARRPARIDYARANADEVRDQNEIDDLTAQQALVDEGVAAWASAHARRALEHALTQAQQAQKKLGAAYRAPTAHITGSTIEQVQTAGTLESRVRGALAGLAAAHPVGPALPADYATLPLQPPTPKKLQRIAEGAPQVALHEAQARSNAALARTYMGNGVDVSVYGGYIAEKRAEVGRLQSGPEVGLRLTVPIGTEDHEKRVAAEWRAKAQRYQAKAAVHQRDQALRQLAQQWVGDVASLQAAEVSMQSQAGRLHTMRLRAQQPASGVAPEPGVVALQAASFWYSVGQVWQARAQWMQDVLTWGLFDPTYLQRASRPANAGAGESLCAPLKSCTSA